MKVLYGVVGEGMGHAMRSRVLLDHLTTQGHEVHVMTSQRAVQFLSSRFPNVREIHGLHLIYEENRVRRGKTLWTNLLAGARAIPRQIRSYFELIEAFEPDAVVSDFESWTYLYGRIHRLPVYSIDNIQMINRCRHEDGILNVDRQGFEVARAFVKSKLPSCDHYLITTFYYPPVRKERTTLVPPILRPEILSVTPTRGDHLLVYQTAEGHGELSRILQDSGLECRIYGMRRDITDEQVEGNLRYRPFSENGFMSDLSSAKAVIAGGGFSLMSECVYLRKPMLSSPVRRQFEQLLNALYLEREGYGMYAEQIDQHVLNAFLERLTACERALAHYEQDGNRLACEALDGLLDRAAARV